MGIAGVNTEAAVDLLRLWASQNAKLDFQDASVVYFDDGGTLIAVELYVGNYRNWWVEYGEGSIYEKPLEATLIKGRKQTT